MFSRTIIVGALAAFMFAGAPIMGDSLGYKGMSAEAAQKSKASNKKRLSKKGTYRNDSSGPPVYRRGF